MGSTEPGSVAASSSTRRPDVTTTKWIEATPGPTHRRSNSVAGPSLISSLVGLLLVLGVPPLYSQFLYPRVAETWPDSHIPGVIGLGLSWLLAGCATGVVLVWQRQPPAALGLRPLSWRGLALASAAGVVCGASVPVLVGLAQRVLPGDGGGTVASLTTGQPAWLMLMAVVTAACAEELLYRAFTIGQIWRLTGHIWLGAAIGLIGFVLQHVGGWSLAHVIGAVLPIGALYTIVYVWRRNLPLVIVMHFVADLPIVLITAGVIPSP